MRGMRLMGELLAALALLLLAGFGPPGIGPLPPAAEPAKLGFSYLSAAQQKDLWRRADDYALAEAFLRACGSPPHIERRMRLAARDCIEARALDRVAAYFRRKVAEFTAKHTFACDTEQSKALVKTIRSKVDKAVEEVRSMCRACLFC
jgi:hypothetical protein